MLLVSAHRPVPLLSWTQLLVTRAPLTSQNLPPPVQPQPRCGLPVVGVVAGDFVVVQDDVLWRPSTAAYMLKPYCPLSFKQL